MNTRSINSLAATRGGLLSAIGTNLPDDAMTALIDQLYEIERRIIEAPCTTYDELAIKAHLLADKLSDRGGVDALIGLLVERLSSDHDELERQAKREEQWAMLRMAQAA